MTGVKRLGLGAGMAAPLVYLVTVVIGGWITPGYTHLQMPVSALFESGAPYALPVSAAFVAYNLLLLVFAFALRAHYRDQPAALRLAAVMVGITALAGLLIELAPMDPLGAPATLPGMVHLVLAGLLSLGSAGAIGLGIWGELKRRDRRAATIAAVALAVLVVAAAAAALAVTQGFPFMGVYQRLTIGAYLFWVFRTAITEMRRA